MTYVEYSPATKEYSSPETTLSKVVSLLNRNTIQTFRENDLDASVQALTTILKEEGKKEPKIIFFDLSDTECMNNLRKSSFELAEDYEERSILFIELTPPLSSSEKIIERADASKLFLSDLRALIMDPVNSIKNGSGDTSETFLFVISPSALLSDSQDKYAIRSFSSEPNMLATWYQNNLAE